MNQRDGFWEGVDGHSWSARSRRGRSGAPGATYEQAFGEADRLVTRLLEEVNQMLLGGRGAVSSRRSDWSPALHVWQLWEDPQQERGAYLYLSLLQTSRDRPYLKVGRQAIPLDARTEQRLAFALRRAFAQPRFRVPVPPGRILYSSRARYEVVSYPVSGGLPPGVPPGELRPAEDRAGQNGGANPERSDAAHPGGPAEAVGHGGAGTRA